MSKARGAALVLALGCSSAPSPSMPDGGGRRARDAALAADASGSDAPADASPRRDGWRRLADAPRPRARHVAAWTGSELVVWGGETDDAAAGLRYQPSSDRWSEMATQGAPAAPLVAPVAVWTGTELVVWGGANGTPSRRGARYSPATDVWAPMSEEGAPSSRAGHTMVWAGSEVLVWGGFDAMSALGSGGRYDPVSDRWRSMATQGEPPPRSGHSFTWTGSEVVVWGGVSGTTDQAFEGRSDGARYEPASDAWRLVSLAGAPSPRSNHAAFHTGREVIIVGGTTGPDAFPRTDGAAWDPIGDRWRPLPTSPRYGARVHSAVWTGRELLIWYGRSVAGVPDPAMPAAVRFDPEAGALEAIVGPMDAENDAAATLTWTGSVALLVGGRRIDDPTPLGAAYSYQP